MDDLNNIITQYIMEISIDTNNIKPTLSETIYSIILKCGFTFIRGLKSASGLSIESIADMNQKMFKNKSNWLKLLDLQLLFSLDIFSKVRVFWQFFGGEIRFKFIVEESLILQNTIFDNNKIQLLEELAIRLWNSSDINAIQGHTQYYTGGCYNLNSIYSGKDVMVEPFAIIPMVVYEKFMPGYFSNHIIKRIRNNGILILDTNNRLLFQHKEDNSPKHEAGHFAERLITLFPEYTDDYIEHMKDNGELLEHCFFSDTISRTLYVLLRENEDKDRIQTLVRFIEDMLTCGDDNVVNVVYVSIIENLVCNDSIREKAYKYFSKDLTEAARALVRHMGWI